MGKVEEQTPYLRHTPEYTPWHGHITALTVAPQYRRLGLAKLLTESLERASNEQNAWFVDLYVRESNEVAGGLYRGMGYVCSFVHSG
jgi:N-terminal acetyltransferase B complex catalytic subunit